MLPLLLALTCAAPDFIDPTTGKKDGTTVYFDVRGLGVEGQGWKELASPFDRLPKKAEKLVRPAVWSLSRHSAGQAVRFLTDATTISARWSLTSPRLAMVHMPATGVSGLDLYVRDEKGKWRWLGIGRPSAKDSKAALVTGLPKKGLREFMLYLPLYNGVTSVEIGIPEGAKLAKAPPRPAHKKPIVFYGTSITHGGCASRPGMAYPAILGRRFDWPTINLGFSGNGRLEIELAKLLGEIDAAAYFIDCLPNISAKDVEARTVPFVKELRKARPDTPIILVEDRSYANAHMLPGVAKRNADSRAALYKAFREMTWDGVQSIHYIDGPGQLGDDDEGTVDSSHPTDLGFMRQAEWFAPRLNYVLPVPEAPRRVVEGYASQISYSAGDTVKLHVSCSAPEYAVEVSRMGDVRHKKAGLVGKEHPIPKDASSHGCRWPVGHEFSTKGWPSGYYHVRLTATRDGKKHESSAFFILRPAEPGKSAKILMPLSTNTYNAYTNWGGYSLYAYHARNRVQGRRVSFERPQYSQFNRWEEHFVRWAEKAGYKIDYCANLDIEQRPELLKAYKLVLSVGHDEYWSAGMRDALEKYISGGGNVAFFSGNTCCWQVRPEEDGKALVCYKQAYRADPLFAKGERKILATLWSHHLLNRPENGLTGVGFLHGGYHRSHGQLMTGSGAFTVERPDHWLFEGTKLAKGALFGGKHKIVGYECDGCEFTRKGGLPVPTGSDGTPKDFTILATAPAKWHPDDAEWYEKWPKGHTGHAVVGIYKRGGTVFTVGTTDWARGLQGGDLAVERITKNVLDRLSK
jgi:hypothetical protein